MNMNMAYDAYNADNVMVEYNIYNESADDEFNLNNVLTNDWTKIKFLCIFVLIIVSINIVSLVYLLKAYNNEENNTLHFVQVDAIVSNVICDGMPFGRGIAHCTFNVTYQIINTN